MKTGRIKINSQLSETIFANQLVENIKGLNSVEIKDGILYYQYLETYSDYDIMVAILNILEDKNIDAEPLFDDEEIVEVVTIDDTKQETIVEETDSQEVDQFEETEEDEEVDEQDEEDKIDAKKERKVKIIQLGISVVLLIASFILSSLVNATVAGYVQVVAFVVVGYEVIFEAINKIINKKYFSSNLLMSIASLSAIALGHNVEAVAIMILYTIGELFEDGMVDNSKKVIEKLKNLNPLTVNLVKEDGKVVTTCPSQVEVGQIIIVKAGEKVAIDGIIIDGKANVDAKALTGESSLKTVEVGDEVLGGYISTDGVLKIKTTKSYQESAINKIIEIVQTSQEKKSKSEKFIEKFSKYYTPIVLLLALLVTFVGPIFTEDYALYLSDFALKGIMLLCISCPCSIAISVPLTYFCGLGNCAINGVLVKGSNYLESLSKCKIIAFDKTGTLTEGKFTITKIQAVEKYKGKVLEFANIAEQYSTHPIAVAIKEKANKIVDGVENYTEIAGRGISCEYNGQKILCGNGQLLSENGVKFIESKEIGMKLYLAVDGEYAGVVILNDKLRDKAKGAILELYDAGVENTVMLTGDNKEYAVKIRKELQMKQSVSNLLPQEKVSEIERLISQNKNKTVAFVGDGINDAPSLSRADIGIAMGGIGSHLSIDSADVVISNDDLSKVPFLVKIAKRTNKIAKQNIVVSLLVKLIIGFLAILGLSTSLYLAIGADVGILILAILNSMRNRLKVV